MMVVQQPRTGSVQCEQPPVVQEEEETMSATPRDHRTTERHQDDDDDDDAASSIFTTLVNFVASLLVPFLLQFLFGGFALLKTLVWGYCLQSAVHVLSCAEDTVGIPSALLGIAVLTLVAMLVHPDGLTWIFARSLRDGFVLILQSSSNIWAVLVHDYGTMVSSLLALLTFAALFLVAFAMHRTLASRTPASGETRLTEKQKRKRKKAHGRGGGKGRIRASHKTKGDVGVESRDESEIINLPPLCEDKAVISVPLPLQSEKLSIPDLDSVSSSVDDGGSVATSDSLFIEKPSSIVTTNLSDSAVAQLIRNSFEDVSDKANRKHCKQQPIAPQQRSPPPSQRNPSLVPSKRWDALKPSARSVVPASRYSKTTWTPPRPKSHKPKQQEHSSSKKQPPSLHDRTPAATTITSDLNPETPEWNMQSSNNTTPLRPPPGLRHPKDIPFGCSSMDEDDVSSWLLLRQLDVRSLDTTTTATDTMTPPGFPLTTLTPPLPPPGLAQNDGTHDDDDAMIEAELQRLGGQMIGSILDF